MNNLIEIREQVIDQEAVQTVNASELHTFMGIGKRFATWITDRINQYEFEEGKDFIKTQDCGFKNWEAQNLGLLQQLIITLH